MTISEPKTRASRGRVALRAHDEPAIRLHDLRHTHATLLLEQGVGHKVAPERLRHAEVATTLGRYGHVTSVMQQEAALGG